MRDENIDESMSLYTFFKASLPVKIYLIVKSNNQYWSFFSI